MPRGLGKTQLAIIAQLRIKADLTAIELACHVYDRQPQEVTQNQLQAVRKALKSLFRYSIVELVDYRSLEGEKRWRLGEKAESSRKVKPPPKVAGFKPRVVPPNDP